MKKRLLIFVLLSFFTITQVFASVQNGWINENNNTFYYIDGIMQKGIVEIEGYKYFFGELTGFLKRNMNVTSLDGTTYKVDEEGKLYTGFYDENGNTFYYIDGIMQKGIVEIEEYKYFFGELTGFLKRNMNVTSLDGTTYKVDEEGKLYTGFYDENGNTFYYIDGIMQKGIIEIEGYKYFFGELTGFLKRNMNVTSLDGTAYRVDEEGKLYTGFYDENGNTFYYIDGIMQKGIIEIEGYKYFFGELTGFLKRNMNVTSLDGTAYRVDEEGKLYTGFYEENGNTFYYIDGLMQKGIIEIEGYKYFFGELTGFLKRNMNVTSLDGTAYRVDKEGKLYTGFYDENGNTFYYIDGLMQKGIIEIDGYKYFFGELTGFLKKDSFIETLDKENIITDNNGIIRTGLISYKNNQYYTDDCYLFKGFNYVDVHPYFFDETTSKMIKDSFVTSKTGDTYYADKEGILVSGFQYIDDLPYFFGEHTNKLYKNVLVTSLNGDIFYPDKNGVLQTNVKFYEDKPYFFGELSYKMRKGTLVTSLSGDTYYPDDEGVLRNYKQIIDDKTYFFGELSYKLMKNRFVNSLDGKIYYANETGELVKGIRSIDNVLYSFGEDFTLQTGYQTLDGKTYYFYLDGTKATGVVKIEGHRNYFDFVSGELLRTDVKKIIDVSTWQDDIDWDTLWNSGEIDGAIIRIGYGIATDEPATLDNKFYRNLEAIRRLNIPYSVYIYGYAQTPSAGELEARFVGDILKTENMQLSMPVWYDAEVSYYGGVNYTSSVYEPAIMGFANELQKYGYYTGIYSSVSWFDNYNGRLNTPVLRNFPLWVAQYYDYCEYSGNYLGWQYTSKEILPGIDTYVDVSIFY